MTGVSKICGAAEKQAALFVSCQNLQIAQQLSELTEIIETWLHNGDMTA